MAKFLTTAGTAYHIEQLIINAQDELVLVTPYLQLSTNFRDRLLDANDRDIDIKLIYGKSELKPKEEELLRSLDNIHIYYLDNLHAKCYYNDSELIIASMNLYAFPERNNREMGILIDSEKDKKLYNEALREVESILNASQLEFKPQKNSTLEVELDSNFSEKWNFHLPYLYDRVSEKYESFETEFLKEDEKVEISNFPISGFKLSISHRIDLIYDEDK